MAALAGFFSCSTAIDLPVAVADQDLQPGVAPGFAVSTRGTSDAPVAETAAR
jgi:hypothetical protein